MKVLYLTVGAGRTATPNLLKDLSCQVIFVTGFRDAVKFVQTESFDALLIDEGDMHPDTLDFTLDVRRVRPELPIFVISDWGADLALALQSLEAFAPAAAAY